MGLLPDEDPRAVFVGKSLGAACVVVFDPAPVRIIGVTDVESPERIFEHVRPERTVGRVQARQVGLEPTTSRLTAGCSTIELLPNF